MDSYEQTLWCADNNIAANQVRDAGQNNTEWITTMTKSIGDWNEFTHTYILIYTYNWFISLIILDWSYLITNATFQGPRQVNQYYDRWHYCLQMWAFQLYNLLVSGTIYSITWLEGLIPKTTSQNLYCSI